MKKKSLEQKIDQLKKEAEDKGLLDNVIFEELLDTFYCQTTLMKRMKEEIDKSDLMMIKTYNGAENLYPNKLISTYNATSNARANTVDKLTKLVKAYEVKSEEEDVLLKLMEE